MTASGAPDVGIVDASAFFRDALRDRLAAEGHACRVFASLDEAAPSLDDPEAGVWIVDLASTDEAGLAALRRLCAERPATRVVVLASASERDRALEAVRAGACDVQPKPLHEEMLALSVARAVAGWRADRDRAPAPAEAGAAPEADLELVRELCEAVIGEGDPRTLPGRLLAILGAHLGADGAALYVVEPGGAAFVREAVWEAGAVGDRERIPADRGLSGAVASTGVLAASADPAADPRFDPAVDPPADPRFDPAVDPPARGLLCLPLRFRRNTVGLVRVHLAPEAVPALRTAESAAAALSAALRSVLLYRSWRSSIDEVARIRRESVGRPGAPGRVAPPPSSRP